MMVDDIEWTRSTIAERLYNEMNQWDENQEPFSEQKKYYIDALQYANRRAIVEKPSEFQDVFHVYMLTLSEELRNHIQRLDEDTLNEVISEAIKRIIKARKPEVYYDYLQFEPLRWDLINGDGNGKGDGSLIAEHVAESIDTSIDTEKSSILENEQNPSRNDPSIDNIDNIDNIPKSKNKKSSTKQKKDNIKIYRVASQIRESETIFVDQFHAPWAFVRIKEHMELLNLNSQRFEYWVYRKLILQDPFGQPILPRPVQVQTVLNYIKSHAEFDAEQRMLYLRVASDDIGIYYDLTNKDWQTIKIIPEGWLIESTPTIMFRRQTNQLEQVYPSREYEENIFDKFINLLNIKKEDHKLLLKCYIIALLVPDIPKAILMLHGEPNSAKTTLLELIKMLIDPSSTRTLTCRKDNAEMAQQLDHNYLPYYDNLSFIPEWLSDTLCRASTGDSFSKRTLFTNDDDTYFSYIRNVGFSGVNLAATKSDLLRRGLIIELERIHADSQRQVKQIWKEFEQIKPQLLGYIFDILSRVIKRRRAGSINVKGLPSLADWGEWCELISQEMGNEPDVFIQAFNRNIETQNEAAIEDSVIAEAVIYLMENQKRWDGTAANLLAQLETFAPLLGINIKDHKSWPSRPNVLARRLKYVISNLKELHDITIRAGDDSSSKKRTICIEKGNQEEKSDKLVKSSIPSIHRYSDENRAQITSDMSIGNNIGIDTGIDTIPKESWNGRIEPDHNYGDFQCFHCEQYFSSDANRRIHCEGTHPERLVYPEPYDFVNRLIPNREPTE